MFFHQIHAKSLSERRELLSNLGKMPLLSHFLAYTNLSNYRMIHKQFTAIDHSTVNLHSHSVKLLNFVTIYTSSKNYIKTLDVWSFLSQLSIKHKIFIQLQSKATSSSAAGIGLRFFVIYSICCKLSVPFNFWFQDFPSALNVSYLPDVLEVCSKRFNFTAET